VYTVALQGESQEQAFAERDQVAAEFVYFSDCILQNKTPEPSGQEGLIDVCIIQALYESMETGQFVKLDLPQRSDRPEMDQSIQRSRSEHKPELVHAADPSGKS
jgi:hypothetical protein